MLKTSVSCLLSTQLDIKFAKSKKNSIGRTLKHRSVYNAVTFDHDKPIKEIVFLNYLKKHRRFSYISSDSQLCYAHFCRPPKSVDIVQSSQIAQKNLSITASYKNIFL